MYIMTWIWGLGLVFEAALRFWLAFAWPVEQFLAISPFISYGIYFSLMGWSCGRLAVLKLQAKREHRRQENELQSRFADLMCTHDGHAIIGSAATGSSLATPTLSRSHQ
jgi:hypothetical protein